MRIVGEQNSTGSTNARPNEPRQGVPEATEDGDDGVTQVPLLPPRDFRKAVLSNLGRYITDEPFNRIAITNKDKLVYDKWPVAPKEILQKACAMVQGKLDVLAFGDGVPTPHFSNFATHVYTVIDGPHVPPQALIGCKSLWHFPSYMPFEDSSPHLSLHTYSNFFKQVLLMATKARLSTEIIIAIQSRSSPPNPALCPLLDRRIDIDSCRKWFSQIVVVPNVVYDLRNEENGELVRSPLFSEKPMVLYYLKSTSKFQRIEAPIVEQLFVAPSHSQVPAPPCEAMHVIFDVPKFVTRADGQSVEGSPLRMHKKTRMMQHVMQHAQRDVHNAPPPPRQGGWAATTTIALVRRM